MLPDVGATELLLIAAVALIVVGPKDLPVLMRKVGKFLARMRGMAAEFRASFDEMARQSELDELRREVQALRSGQYLQPAQAAATAAQAEVAGAFRDIDGGLTAIAHDEAPTRPSAQAETPPPVATPVHAAEPTKAARRKPPAAPKRAKAAAPKSSPARPRPPRKPKAPPKADAEPPS